MRVEGARGGGVVRQEVEVCVVLFEDEAAEGFLVGGAGGRVLVLCPMDLERGGRRERVGCDERST